MSWGLGWKRPSDVFHLSFYYGSEEALDDQTRSSSPPLQSSSGSSSPSQHNNNNNPELGLRIDLEWNAGVDEDQVTLRLQSPGTFYVNKLKLALKTLEASEALRLTSPEVIGAKSYLCVQSLLYSTKRAKKEATIIADEITPHPPPPHDYDAPTSAISCPISKILKELNKKVPESLIRVRTEANGFAIKHVPWHNLKQPFYNTSFKGQVKNIMIQIKVGNRQGFGGSSIKNVGSTNMFNNRISATEAFDGRSGTVMPGSLLRSVAHPSAQNLHQQKPFQQNSYNMGFPIAANDVQSNFQNNPEATHLLGTKSNTQTSNRRAFLKPQVHMAQPPLPGRWVRQIPAWEHSNGFKIPRINSWESVQGGRPLVAEASSGHNCNGLNCNMCGHAASGMTFGKRKYHFVPPCNESWSGGGALMESRKQNYHFETSNNESWVSNSTDQMESKRQRCHLEPLSNYESCVSSGTLMDVLIKSYLPLDLPPLEQWPNSNEDASCLDANNKNAVDAMRNGPDGKEE